MDGARSISEIYNPNLNVNYANEIIKNLPSELMQGILKYCNNRDLLSAALVNHQWKVESVEVARRREVVPLMKVVEFLYENLYEESNSHERKLLAEVINSKESILSSKIKASILKLREVLSKVLLNKDEIERLKKLANNETSKLLDNLVPIPPPPPPFKHQSAPKFLGTLKRSKAEHQVESSPIRFLKGLKGCSFVKGRELIDKFEDWKTIDNDFPKDSALEKKAKELAIAGKFEKSKAIIYTMRPSFLKDSAIHTLAIELAKKCEYTESKAMAKLMQDRNEKKQTLKKAKDITFRLFCNH